MRLLHATPKSAPHLGPDSPEMRLAEYYTKRAIKGRDATRRFPLSIYGGLKKAQSTTKNRDRPMQKPPAVTIDLPTPRYLHLSLHGGYTRVALPIADYQAVGQAITLTSTSGEALAAKITQLICITDEWAMVGLSVKASRQGGASV